MTNETPVYTGNLRSHTITIPQSIYACSGIRVFGRKIRSLVFSTDVAIIKNINTDAVLAVYPFTPQSCISNAIISVSDAPVFVGVGGGVTAGERSVRLAEEAEHQGAFGVVVNAPMPAEVITQIKQRIELPVVATIISEKQDATAKIEAGADILNVAASKDTPALVAHLRTQFPQIPIIATGGPTDTSIQATIAAGANAITYTPPTNGDIFAESMRKYRNQFSR